MWISAVFAWCIVCIAGWIAGGIVAYEEEDISLALQAFTCSLVCLVGLCLGVAYLMEHQP